MHSGQQVQCQQMQCMQMWSCTQTGILRTDSSCYAGKAHARLADHWLPLLVVVLLPVVSLSPYPAQSKQEPTTPYNPCAQHMAPAKPHCNASWLTPCHMLCHQGCGQQGISLLVSRGMVADMSMLLNLTAPISSSGSSSGRWPSSR